MSRIAGGIAVAIALLLAGCSHGHVPPSLPTDAEAPPPLALVVVDGLDAREVTDGDMPWLTHAWHTSAWCPDAHGTAAMPARTNVNHATFVTGVEPEIHGVTGNAFWGRTTEAPRKLGGAADLMAETLFTVAHARTPPLRTAAAVGKAKLQLMFAAAPNAQWAPSAMWGPDDAAASDREPVTGYAFDAATLSGARGLLDGAPVFLLVNLADVDRVSHANGPRSAAARATRTATDRALAAFVGDVRARPEWRHGTIVITADHGFDAVTHPAIDIGARLRAAGLEGAVVGVADGGVAHIYAREPHAPGAPATLATARRIARATDGIAEALYLAPNPLDGGDAALLARVHPDWHLTQERGGDLLLVAAPGYVLAEPGRDEAQLLGNHGAPAECDVPLVVVGEERPSIPGCARPRAADVGVTLFRCLGLRDAVRLDGAAVAAEARGHEIAGICAPRPIDGAGS